MQLLSVLDDLYPLSPSFFMMAAFGMYMGNEEVETSDERNLAYLPGTSAVPSNMVSLEPFHIPPRLQALETSNRQHLGTVSQYSFVHLPYTMLLMGFPLYPSVSLFYFIRYQLAARVSCYLRFNICYLFH